MILLVVGVKLSSGLVGVGSGDLLGTHTKADCSRYVESSAYRTGSGSTQMILFCFLSGSTQSSFLHNIPLHHALRR